MVDCYIRCWYFQNSIDLYLYLRKTRHHPLKGAPHTQSSGGADGVEQGVFRIAPYPCGNPSICWSLISILKLVKILSQLGLRIKWQNCKSPATWEGVCAHQFSGNKRQTACSVLSTQPAIPKAKCAASNWK